MRTWLGLSIVALGTLAAIPAASAAKGGAVFLHGTGDYPGSNLNGDNTVTCSGTGDAFVCKTPWSSASKDATSSYWTQEFVDSTRKRSDGTYRPYVVVGCYLGARMPWQNDAPLYDNDTSIAGEHGTADCAATQIERFIRGPDATYGTTDDITDLVIITHSGGSNVARHIIVRYTGSTTWSRVKTATKKVVALAPPSRGTYLANWVFTGGSIASFINSTLQFFGANGLYNDDGVKFIQTGQMDLSNNDLAKLKVSGSNPLANPVNGITFRAGYGTYPDAAVWDGKAMCGGYAYNAGLNLLHRLYLSQNDASTYRSNCSDGFLSCQSMSAMGQVFNIASGSENSQGAAHFLSHNQSRRNKSGCSCGLFAGSSCYSSASAWDVKVRNEVNSTVMAYTEAPVAQDAADVPAYEWDTCQFATAGWIAGSTPARYTKGCADTWLGDGWCDTDCLGAYGRDAVPTWVDPLNHAKGVASWGTDDCAYASNEDAFDPSFNGNRNNPTDTVAETFEYSVVTRNVTGSPQISISGSPTLNANYYLKVELTTAGGLGVGKFRWTADRTATTIVWNTNVTVAASVVLPGTGITVAFNSGSYLVGDNYTFNARDVAYCPDSWVGDGECDECLLAKYGADGNDCRPGMVSKCTGAYVESDVTSSDSLTPSRSRVQGNAYYVVTGATCGNSACEFNECSTCAADCTGYCE